MDAPKATRSDFKRAAARRIAAATLAISCVSTPLAWYIAREKAENRLLTFSIEESRRLIGHFDAMADPSSPAAAENAKRAAEIMTGGLFDVAKIYDKHGVEIAESFSIIGQTIWSQLPKHSIPKSEQAAFESVSLSSDRWVLRARVKSRLFTHKFLS